MKSYTYSKACKLEDDYSWPIYYSKYIDNEYQQDGWDIFPYINRSNYNNIRTPKKLKSKNKHWEYEKSYILKWYTTPIFYEHTFNTFCILLYHKYMLDSNFVYEYDEELHDHTCRSVIYEEKPLSIIFCRIL